MVKMSSNSSKDFFDNTEDSVKKLAKEIQANYLGFVSGIWEESDSYDDDVNIKQCESPVERMFFLALQHTTNLYYGDFMSYVELQREIEVKKSKYRVDFLVGVGHPHYQKGVEFVIEVDGHDYHEKTKSQAARDKKRDRDLSNEVDGIIRFTGSEVYNDPLGVAEETMSIISKNVWKKIHENK